MGLYTTINCADGTSMQIKTGFDACKDYSVGDQIEESRCIDGPWLGTRSNPDYDRARDGDDWDKKYLEDRSVLIIEGKVVGIVPVDKTDESYRKWLESLRALVL